jgi:hypothetical protein
MHTKHYSMVAKSENSIRRKKLLRHKHSEEIFAFEIRECSERF